MILSFSFSSDESSLSIYRSQAKNHNHRQYSLFGSSKKASFFYPFFQDILRRRASSPAPQTVNSVNGPTGLAAASPVGAESKYAPNGSARNLTMVAGRVPNWTTSTRYRR